MGLVKKIRSCLSDIIEVTSIPKDPEKFRVYEGFQEEIAPGMYQTFLFKMNQTLFDKIIGGISDYVGRYR